MLNIIIMIVLILCKAYQVFINNNIITIVMILTLLAVSCNALSFGYIPVESPACIAV